jgi:hypothetical protein
LLTCQIDRNRLVAAQCEAGEDFVDDVVKLNNVLYKVVGYKLIPIIPESLVPEVISAFHDSLVAGHGGVEGTMTKVSRSAYFK